MSALPRRTDISERKHQVRKVPKAEAEANRLRHQQSINRDRLPCVYFALVAFKLRIATVAERLVQSKEAMTEVALQED
jgi:hypothetical protein